MRRGGGRGTREGEDAVEIPVSYDKRDNGLSNYPAKRLNRATMKFVLSASFFFFRGVRSKELAAMMASLTILQSAVNSINYSRIIFFLYVNISSNVVTT
jgi:hypothetical protein